MRCTRVLSAFFALVAFVGAASAAGIEWQPSFDDVVARAKAEKKVVFIAVNMDRERANDRLVADHYKDATLAKLASHTLNLFCSRFDHASGEKPCPRAGSVACSAHMAVEKAVRAKILKPADGGDVVSPQHVFLDPDGKVILSVQYEISKAELEWCFVTALRKVDPAFAWTLSGGARAPRRLVMDGVVSGEAMEQAPTKQEVEQILERLKRGEPAREMREEILRLFKSDDPRAKEYVGNLLTSKGANRENWITILVHELGRSSPQDWSELAIRFLEDARVEVRAEAAVALEQLADPKSLADVTKAFKREKEDSVKRELLRAIASTGRADKKTAATLTEQFTKAKDEATRCAALIGAAALEDSKAARALLEPALASEVAAFRAAAACALAIRRDREAHEAMLDAAALKEPDPSTKSTLEAALKVLRGGDVAKIDETANILCGSTIVRDRK
ncbi:MAG: HEAT repeat domain-containing protein [Planctomycetes bacterium]|nr:HEAT repeat domain-containing protein [Planctomycetota bacterium]